jgi:UDP-N-acetylmuramate dehydrogenase
VQNVGAYGQEISQTLTELTVFDIRNKKFKILSNADCKFAYRDSIFKSRENRKYIICDITLQLNRENLKPPFYESLQKYLDENEITDFSPQKIRDTVIAIRNQKLPPVREIPSAGSFFKNPIVDEEIAQKLLAEFPDAPHWPMPEKREKLAAGWLIERAGLKGFAKYGFQVFPQNALVITNIENSTAENLAKFKAEIVARVREKFGVTLEQEPENL